MRLASLVGYAIGYDDAARHYGAPLWDLIFDVELDYMAEDMAMLAALDGTAI